MFTFLWFELALLFPLPFLWRMLKNGNKQDTVQQDALRVPFFKMLAGNLKHQSLPVSKVLKLVFYLAWCFFVLALMRPVWFGEEIKLPKQVRQIMMVLDISGSMMEKDFVWNGRQTTRIDAVKAVTQDFIEKRKSDALGMILFGTQPYVYIPTTTDNEAVRQMTKEIAVGLAGDMTAMGDALALSVKQMKDVPAETKVVILMSDGYANAGSLLPEEAMQLAQDNKIKVYTIGLGADVMYQPTFFGTFQTNPSSDLDEKVLKQIAETTGGKYFRAKSSEDLKNIYAELDKLEKTDDKDDVIRPRTDLFFVPLLCSMLLFFFGFLMKGRFR